MAISLKHSFQSAKADGADASLVRPSNWNAEHTLTLAASRLLGRASATNGAAEEIVLGTGFSFSGTTLNFSTSAQLGYTPVNKAGDTMTGQLTLSSSAPILRWQDTTSSAYDGRIRLDANNFYIDGSADGTTYAEVLRFELDTKASYFTGLMNITTAGEAIRINGSSATVDPYIRFQQAAVNKGYLQYNDGALADAGMRLVNEVATGGALEFVLSNNGGVGGAVLGVNGTNYTMVHTGNIDVYDLAKYYTGSTQDATNFPLGHMVITATGTLANRNQTTTVYLRSETWAYTTATGHGAALAGTYRQRGGVNGGDYQLFQRVA